MHRRTFVQGLAAAIAAPIAAPACHHALGATRPAASEKPNIGIQLYTLRDAARQNLERTLADIASVGYTEVELLASMKNFDMPAARLRQVLDGLHLRAPSTHIGAAEFDDFQRLLDDSHTLGHEYVILASLPGSQRTLDDYRRWADRLNAAGETARKANIWVGFHDEAYDFPAKDGQVPYEVLVERTDPKLVRLQLDTGNAAMGGRDPVDLMKRYRDRYFLFHIKDAPSLGAPHDAELGKGVVDLKQIISLMGSLADKHLFVEQESYPGGALDSARRDYAYLAGLLKS
jgi:sugar phosphate isomerase/epimerase